MTKVITGTGDNYGFEEETVENAIIELYQQYAYIQPQVETIVKGTLTSIGKYATFSTMYKSDIIVLLNNNENNILEGLNIGDETDIYITSIKNDVMYGSLYMVEYHNLNNKVHNLLTTTYENGDTLTGIPISYSLFGYDVAVNFGFGEMIMHMPHLVADVNKLPNADSIVGQEIEFKIDKDEKGEFIISRKAHLLTLAKKELKELNIGQIYTGHVTGCRPFGIFVQIGNNTGMIYEPNLMEENRELLRKGEIEPGMLIDVYLKDINKDKLILSQLDKKSMWDTLKIGDKISGKISNVKIFDNNDFGVLVNLDYETRGMIHSSNANGKNKEYFKIGSKIDVKVLNILKNKRQITLGYDK